MALQKIKIELKQIETVKWGTRPAIWLTFLAYIVSQVSVIIPYGLIFLVSGQDKATDLFDDNTWVSFFVIAFSAVTMVAVIYIYLNAKKFKLADLGFRSLKPKDYLNIALFAILYLIISAVILSLAGLIPGFNLNQEQDIGFGAVEGWQLVAVFISLVIIPPLAEEIVFRGFFYRGLKSHWQSRPVIYAGVIMAVVTALVTANIFTGLAILIMTIASGLAAKLNIKLGAALFVSSVFGLVHGQWNVALDTFVLSVVMIALYEKTNTLWACVFLHGLKNFIAFLALFVISGN